MIRVDDGQQFKSWLRMIVQDNLVPADTLLMFVLNASGIKHSSLMFIPSQNRL